MTIIILGSNGMLGSMLCFLCKTQYKHIPSIAITKSDFDVLTDSIDNLDDKLGRLLPDSNYTIINCIGAIPQKKYTPDEYTKINTKFPQDLSAYCKSRNYSLLHISTNCVFSGKNDNCLESDIPDADDVYGKSKLLGEPSSYGLTIRCSIIGPEKHTFCGLMEWFLNNNSSEIGGFTDSFWNGLTTLELSKIIFEIISTGKIQSGLLHYYSENTLSKYQILEALKSNFNKQVIINKKENGLKYYTLSSIHNKPRKNIYIQLNELAEIFNKYKSFWGLHPLMFGGG
jgi:dTDP-4-dehydrorhamnose reductase